MHMRIIVLFALIIVPFVIPTANAQDATGHWGIQGDAAWMSVPKSIIDKIHALPEKPDITGATYGVGIVRFNKNGAPSYALQYSNLRVSIDGTEQQSQFQRHISGAGSMRGFMATKYLNFVTRKKVCGGLAFGGGVGELKAHYVRSFVSPSAISFGAAKQYEHVVPLFEILARLDFRPIRHVTVGPFYGIRNGTLAAGIAVRIHAMK
jgi:hypothetical protein